MSEYSWPERGPDSGARIRAAWEATCRALPVGTLVTGEVVGRQPFGVFLTIDGVPDAIGLAEIDTMPREAELPQLGERLHGQVVDHVDHNCQVRIRPTEGAAPKVDGAPS